MGISKFLGTGTQSFKPMENEEFVEMLNGNNNIVPKDVAAMNANKRKGFFKLRLEKKLSPHTCRSCKSTTQVYSRMHYERGQLKSRSTKYVGESRLPKFFGRHVSTVPASWEDKRWANSTNDDTILASGDEFDESYQKFYGSILCKCGTPIADQYLRVYLHRGKKAHRIWTWDMPHNPHRGEKN